MDTKEAYSALCGLKDKLSHKPQIGRALDYFLGQLNEEPQLDAQDAKEILSPILWSPLLSSVECEALRYVLDPIPSKTKVLHKGQTEPAVVKGQSLWERMSEDERASLLAFMREMKKMPFPNDNGAFMTRRG